jgi:FkbM family methyltransferase
MGEEGGQLPRDVTSCLRTHHFPSCFWIGTKLFYDRDWNGINIEPVASSIEKLRSDRHRDVNLQIAAGDVDGQVDLFDVVGTGLSTVNKELALQHSKASGLPLREYSVQMRTLRSICTEYKVERVHFLKIDVEDSEAAIIRRINLDRVRSWIILAEQTFPMTQIDGEGIRT